MDRVGNESPATGRWLARRLPEIYLVLALLLSASLCVLTPPFDIPDEGAHTLREVQLAHGQVVALKVTQQREKVVGGAADSNLVSAIDRMNALRQAFIDRYEIFGQFPDGRVTADDLRPLQSLRWSGQPVFVSFPNTAIYPPWLYLPQAIGWRIAMAKDLTIFHSLMLARLCAAFCAVAIGWLAMRLSPAGGRWLMFVYLLLPTVVNLAASCSQDAVLSPMAALVGAILWRTIEERRALRSVELAATAVMLTLCIGARVPYLPLAFTLLLPALNLPRPGWRTLRSPLLGALLVVAAIAAWQIVVHPLGLAIRPGASPDLQMALLRTRPLHVAFNLLDAFFHLIPYTLMSGLYMLGSNDAGPVHSLYAVMALGAIGVALLHPIAGLRTRTAKALLLISLLGVLSAIWLAEYLTWTLPGASHVQGLQARYFLPLVPFALLLGWKRIPAFLLAPIPTARGRSLLQLVGAAMFLAGPAYMPWLAAHVFYRASLGSALRIVLQ